MAKEKSQFPGVPFISKDVGLTVRTQSITCAMHIRATGAFAANVTDNATSAHLRSVKIINRRRPIAGTLTPWIPPSGYSRRGDRWILGKTGDYLCSHGLFFIKNSPIRPTGVSLSYGASSTFSKNPFYTNISSAIDTTQGDYSNSRSAARTKALVDLADSKAGVGENLAQAVKTADLFIDAGTDIVRLILELKRGNVWKALSGLNVKQIKKAATSGKIPMKTADQWLAYQYGWKPLALDAYGLYELLLERLKPALLVHGRGQGRMDWQNDWTGGSPGVTSVDPICLFQEKSQISWRCSLTGRIRSEDYLRTLNRIGLLNPVSLAWDLLPFSFIVDWVYPIGDAAFALTAPAGLSFQGGSETFRHFRMIHAEVSPPFMKGNVAPDWYYMAGGIERLPLLDFPRATPYLKSPFMGSSRIATILSLLTKIL